MLGLTIPYHTSLLHLALAGSSGDWCLARRGHKAVRPSEMHHVMGALRAVHSDLFVMRELRALVARFGDPPGVLTDGEVLERIEHLLSAHYLMALECGDEPEPSPALPPAVPFGTLQLHVGSAKDDFSRCDSCRFHEALTGAEVAPRLEQMIRSTPTAARALVEAVSRASGDALLRSVPLEALFAKLSTLAAGGKLIFVICRSGGEGGAAAIAPAAVADAPPLAAPPKPVADEPALTWISIELVDEDGNPLVGEDYEISLSDGSVHKGKTGKSRFYADQIPEGVCSVKYPNLHKNNWKPPGSK